MAAGTRVGSLAKVLGVLEKLYGRPAPPPARGPFEMVLWENVAYLQTEARHEEAFRALKSRVGTTPERILAAPMPALLDVARLGGMHPERRVERLRGIADLVVKEFAGDLAAVLKRPVPEARRALKRFPSIGDPAAEKILVFCGAAALLPLDSNGLRALTRLGFGTEKRSYAATYRGAQEAATASLPSRLREDFGWLARAHLLLRRHGKELCKASNPRCEACPLSPVCRYRRLQR